MSAATPISHGPAVSDHSHLVCDRSHKHCGQHHHPHPEDRMSPATPSRAGWTFVVTSIALFMVTLDNLVVVHRAPRHPRRPRREHRVAPVDRQRLHARLRRVPADGRGARRPLRTPAHLHPRRRDLRTASAAAALAPTADALIVARALQGLGAAFVTPLSLTLLSDAVPERPAWPGASARGPASPASASRSGPSSAARSSTVSRGTGSSGSTCRSRSS